MQLFGYACKNLTAFDGSDAVGEMMSVANLTEPIARRLLTLWKNEAWNETIKECCYTAVGSELFNISLWTELSRHRVEDVRLPLPCVPGLVGT
jgi:hypothetical protein